MTEIALRADAARRLADLRATTALRLPDCCVVLAAQTVGGAIRTFDERLAAAALRLSISVEEPG